MGSSLRSLGDAGGASSVTLAVILSLGLAACAMPTGPATWPAEGTYWRLATLQGQAVPAPSGPREAHLVLQRSSGRAAGLGGCNRFTASYELQGASLRFKQAAATRMACMDGMDTEQAFMKALDATTAWRIEGDRLLLIGVDQAVLAAFQSGSERFACDGGQPLFVHYDNSDPQRPSALLSFQGASHQMRSAPTGSGARYVVEQGRTPDMSLEWLTKGNEGTLMEAPLSDTRQASDLRPVARCTRS